MNPARPDDVTETVRSSPTGLPRGVTFCVLNESFCDITKQPNAPSSSNKHNILFTTSPYTLPQISHIPAPKSDSCRPSTQTTINYQRSVSTTINYQRSACDESANQRIPQTAQHLALFFSSSIQRGMLFFRKKALPQSYLSLRHNLEK